MTLRTKAKSVLVVGLMECDGDYDVWEVETEKLKAWLEGQGQSPESVTIIEGKILKAQGNKEIPTS